MSDNYSAVYNAVRQSIHWPDVGEILRQCFDFSFQMESIRNEFLQAAYEMQRPCVIFKPSISRDGNMWCALYGEDLQNGVAGFGETPAKAMHDFDANWLKQPTTEGSKP